MLSSVYTDLERCARWDSLDKPSFRARFTAPPWLSRVLLLVIAELLGVPERQLFKPFRRLLFVPALAVWLGPPAKGRLGMVSDCPKGWEAHEWIEVGTKMTQNLVWGAFHVFFYTQSKTMSTNSGYIWKSICSWLSWHWPFDLFANPSMDDY